MKLLIFTQENCPTCQKLVKIAESFDKKEMIEFINFNTKEEYFKNYGILSTPTTLFVNEEYQELDRFYGAKDLDFISNFYNENLG